MDRCTRNACYVFTSAWVTTLILIIVYVTKAIRSSILLTVICIVGAIAAFTLLYIVSYVVGMQRERVRHGLPVLFTQERTPPGPIVEEIRPRPKQNTDINEFRLSIDEDKRDNIAVGLEHDIEQTCSCGKKVVIIENP